MAVQSQVLTINGTPCNTSELSETSQQKGVTFLTTDDKNQCLQQVAL
ncbi:hypothetical protein QT231_13350 [Halomonas sp. SpR1]|nr:hypothetical protein [Halomonas sp. SpR1]MDQ7733692.1 hypothetical protein [Halomonas sp. SpR1]